MPKAKRMNEIYLKNRTDNKIIKMAYQKKNAFNTTKYN